MKKIAFVGDSFCAQSVRLGTNHPCEGNSYLDIVADELDADIICTGLGGSALYYAYKQIKTVIEKSDYIVICVTNPNRLYNKNIQVDFNDGMSTTFLNWNDDINEGDEYKKAITLYYKMLYDEEYNLDVQAGFIQLIDNILFDYKQRCIWLPCFENSVNNYIPKSGPIARIPLIAISKSEFSCEEDWISFLSADARDPDRNNHMSSENNKNLAYFIRDMFEQENKNIDIEDYFHFNMLGPGQCHIHNGNCGHWHWDE